MNRDTAKSPIASERVSAYCARGDDRGPRILLVGGEDHDLRIAFLLALRAEGYCVSAAGTGDAAPFAQAGLTYHSFHFDRSANPLADWLSLGALTRIFGQVRPDIVQSFDTKPNILVPLAAGRVGGFPVVRTINGMGWLYSSKAPLALALRPAYCALNRLAARWTSASVFQNREDMSYFERNGMVGDGVSRLIPGSGVDIAAFRPVPSAGDSPAELREQLGLGTSPVVVTVTRVTREKGIPTLLQAAALVHAARPDVRFLLVGPREGTGRFAVSQAEIDAHAPYVVATGKRSDVPALLRLADVFAFPTEFREGVPRVLLEAAVAGLPIIATRMPGCTDVVEHGHTGILVTPGSPQELAQAILQALADPAAGRIMAERAAELVRREFSLELTVDRYRKLYAELLTSASAIPSRPIQRPALSRADDAIP
ncbi:glycosyltransferase [Falsiroseomonas sp. HW251]|uniref:glycosyltransferase n=1 Tax=Falsiroseomonas sp. HW251 TaxID=3390998 RepID=UPI003D31D0F9